MAKKDVLSILIIHFVKLIMERQSIKVSLKILINHGKF
jgi:hypothetical protein